MFEHTWHLKLETTAKHTSYVGLCQCHSQLTYRFWSIVFQSCHSDRRELYISECMGCPFPLKFLNICVYNFKSSVIWNVYFYSSNDEIIVSVLYCLFWYGSISVCLFLTRLCSGVPKVMWLVDWYELWWCHTQKKEEMVDVSDCRIGDGMLSFTVL